MFDRRSLQKIATIDAPNTTFFEWSPCGRFILTATLSPRLRVDNGIKVWHCSGPLMHVQLVDELYQASWRPIPVDAVGPFPQAVPPAPTPNASVALFTAGAKPTATKPAGAYRPPGARGMDASPVYQRDSEPNSGSNTPNRPYNRSPAPGANGYGGSGAGRGRGRYVPGAAPPSSPTPNKEGSGKKQARSKKGKGDKKQNGEPETSLASVVGAEATEPLRQAAATAVAGQAETVSPSADGGALDAVSKKMRNLKKKVSDSMQSGHNYGAYLSIDQLKAIEELKERKENGEHLEDTQIKKINAEKSIHEELEKLSLQSGIPVAS